jgi:hypothetical protein
MTAKNEIIAINLLDMICKDEAISWRYSSTKNGYRIVITLYDYNDITETDLIIFYILHNNWVTIIQTRIDVKENHFIDFLLDIHNWIYY